MHLESQCEVRVQVVVVHNSFDEGIVKQLLWVLHHQFDVFQFLDKPALFQQVNCVVDRTLVRCDLIAVNVLLIFIKYRIFDAVVGID